MEENDEEWLERAVTSTELVAHELLCLGRPSKRVPWRRLLPQPLGEAAPSTVQILEEESGSPASAEFVEPPAWGVRRTRTRKTEGSCAAAGKEVNEPAPGEQASANTPLDFPAGSGSGASVSGGEEGSSAAAAASPSELPGASVLPVASVHGGEEGSSAASAAARPSELGGETKLVSHPPLEVRIPEVRSIERPGKKKKIPELKELEKPLLQVRSLLQEELELKRKAHDSLMEENRRLKRLQLSLQSKSVPPAMVAVAVEKESKESCQLQDCSVIVPLPDLNEPCLEDQN